MDKLKRMVIFILAGLMLTGIIGGLAGYIPLGNPPQVLAADEEEESANEEGGETKEVEEEAPCPECPECPDPAKVVLRGLEEKKQVLAEESDRIAQEKKELENYEAQIDEKLEALTTLKKQIAEDMEKLEQKKSRQEQEKDAAFEAKMNRLVKMYAGMKPKAAAQIVDQMELGVAQEIFMRMREASAAQILSFVDSAKAAKISERLAFKKK